MHHYVDKQKNFLLLFLALFFLSSINSQLFVEKKQSYYDLKSIEVVGLDNVINNEIEKKLNFLKNSNIFLIDREILKDQISKYDYIENYNVIKLYPSKIMLELKQTNFLAKTIKNNEIFLIGSNNKLINNKKFKDYEELPMVFGKFTTEKFISFQKIIVRSGLEYNSIKEIFFYPSGRIDIKNKDNMLIKLPMENLEIALNRAYKLLNDKKFNNNIIDLRVQNQLILSNE